MSKLEKIMQIIKTCVSKIGDVEQRKHWFEKARAAVDKLKKLILAMQEYVKNSSVPGGVKQTEAFIKNQYGKMKNTVERMASDSSCEGVSQSQLTGVKTAMPPHANAVSRIFGSKKKFAIAAISAVFVGIGGILFFPGVNDPCLEERDTNRDVDALFDQGMLYLSQYEEGIKADPSKGVECLIKAAELGHAQAQNFLAMMYTDGYCVKQSAAKAIKWRRKAAEQGVADAQLILGRNYARGEGVEKDTQEAVKWFRKAAEQGVADAQLILGLYLAATHVPEDEQEAVKWYRKAAEQGNAGAQYHLGRCYTLGEGVEKDSQEGIKWLRKAAEQGDADALLWVGMCYGKGEGVEKDTQEAAKWLRKAAEQGSAAAQKIFKNLD